MIKVFILVVGGPGPKVLELFSCSTHLRMKFNLLNNCWLFNIYEQDKILHLRVLKQDFVGFFQGFNLNEQLRFHAQLS